MGFCLVHVNCLLVLPNRLPLCWRNVSGEFMCLARRTQAGVSILSSFVDIAVRDGHRAGF